MFKEVVNTIIELLKQDKVFIRNFVIEVVFEENIDDILHQINFQDDALQTLLFLYLDTKNFIYFAK